MRTVPAAITAARQSSSSRLCKIWRVERVDGVVLRFTEHDRDLVVEGETFVSTASFDPSSIKVNANLSVSDMDVQGAFDSAYIDAADLLAGRYNGASFWVAEVLWDDTAAGKDIIKFGWLGNIRESGGRFIAELLGPERILRGNILDTYTASCRVPLGSPKCGVDLETFTEAGTVTSVSSRRVFNVSGLSLPSGDDLYYEFGLLTFDGSGSLNNGLSMEVKKFDGTTIELMLPMPFDVEAGDSFTVTAGCNHSLSACRFKFNNVLNFRGFPHAPVSDSLLKGITPNDGPEAVAPIEPAPDDGSLSGD